jgi:hypothetical protein
MQVLDLKDELMQLKTKLAEMVPKIELYNAKAEAKANRDLLGKSLLHVRAH